MTIGKSFRADNVLTVNFDENMNAVSAFMAFEGSDEDDVLESEIMLSGISPERMDEARKYASEVKVRVQKLGQRRAERMAQALPKIKTVLADFGGMVCPIEVCIEEGSTAEEAKEKFAIDCLESFAQAHGIIKDYEQLREFPEIQAELEKAFAESQEV